MVISRFVKKVAVADRREAESLASNPAGLPGGSFGFSMHSSAVAHAAQELLWRQGVEILRQPSAYVDSYGELTSKVISA